MLAQNPQVILALNREQILETARRHGASRVRVFGSVARGTASLQSDIDLLVDFAPGHNLMDLGGMLYDLRQLLGVEVDVVTEKAFFPRVRQIVVSEAIEL